MPHEIEKPDLDPASLACISLLKQVLEDARAGNVTSVAVVACGKNDFGANIAGPNAPALNMGLDVLKAKIIQNVAFPTGPEPRPSILRPNGAGLAPRPVPGRRN
jgi:hypothetical protein